MAAVAEKRARGNDSLVSEMDSMQHRPVQRSVHADSIADVPLIQRCQRLVTSALAQVQKSCVLHRTVVFQNRIRLKHPLNINQLTASTYCIVQILICYYILLFTIYDAL